MPKRYVLEVASADSSETALAYHSTQPFSSVTKGDKITLVGPGGKLTTKNVGQVEHTIWMDGRKAVHKMHVIAT